jgi:hypothetical protein
VDYWLRLFRPGELCFLPKCARTAPNAPSNPVTYWYGAACAHRPTISLSGEIAQAAVALANRIITAFSALRAPASKSRNKNYHKTRIKHLNLFSSIPLASRLPGRMLRMTRSHRFARSSSTATPSRLPISTTIDFLFLLFTCQKRLYDPRSLR